MDTLSKAFDESREYDVILMNPPFKGAVDKADVNPTLPGKTTKTEMLFLHLILRALDMGGRCAVIVPDGVLFGSSKAHVEIRRKLIEENRLDGVVSMPSGVFKPYAGVSTAVLLFTRGATDRAHLVLRHGARRLFAGRQAPAAWPRTTSPTCWTAGATARRRRSRPSATSGWKIAGAGRAAEGRAAAAARRDQPADVRERHRRQTATRLIAMRTLDEAVKPNWPTLASRSPRCKRRSTNSAGSSG